MHVHLGALHVLGIFSAVIVAGFFWRTLALCLANSDNNVLRSIGQGMAYIY